LLGPVVATDEQGIRGWANEQAPANKSEHQLRNLQKKSDSGSYIVQFNDDQDIESARGLTKALVNIIGRNPNFVYENSINTPSTDLEWLLPIKLSRLKGALETLPT
jgi:hypothetical protein